MIDSLTLMRSWLLAADSPVPAALGGDRVYRGKLPGGENAFDPAEGPGIVLSLAGGQAHSEILPLTAPRVSIRVWALTGQAAMEVYKVVFGWLHGRTGVDLSTDGFVVSCLEESQPQALTDPDSGWETVLAFYDLKVRDSDLEQIIIPPQSHEELVLDGGTV